LTATLPPGYVARFVRSVVSTVDEVVTSEEPSVSPELLGLDIALTSLRDLGSDSEAPVDMARQITLDVLSRRGLGND